MFVADVYAVHSSCEIGKIQVVLNPIRYSELQTQLKRAACKEAVKAFSLRGGRVRKTTSL